MPDNVKLVIDGAKLAELLSAAGPVGQHLITRATAFQAKARAGAPRKTGCLQDSIVKRPIVDEGERLSMMIVCDTTSCSPSRTSYALFVEEDTRPHDIPGAWGIPAPFGIGGRFEGKFHPGTRGVHFMRNALSVFAE